MKYTTILTVALMTAMITACDNQAKVMECLDGCDKTKVLVPIEAQEGKLTCKVYDLSSSPSVSVMPNFDAMTQSATLQVGSLNNPNVGETDALSMLAGTGVENLKTRVGMVCDGQLEVQQSGSHVLTLRSDDGSELSLEGIQLINHGGLHGYTSKSATVSLDVGVYSLKVKYFQNFGSKGLTLTIRRPGVSFEELLDESFLK